MRIEQRLHRTSSLGIQFVSGLPKTRRGKIIRRIYRKVAENELVSLGDASSLLDPAVVEGSEGSGPINAHRLHRMLHSPRKSPTR